MFRQSAQKCVIVMLENYKQIFLIAARHFASCWWYVAETDDDQAANELSAICRMSILRNNIMWVFLDIHVTVSVISVRA